MQNLYDHDLDNMQQVFESLQKDVGLTRNVDAWCVEVRERFEKIGFIARVTAPYDPDYGCNMPCIEVLDKIVKEPFDYAKQSWEVVNDILEVDPGMKGVKMPFNPDMLHVSNPTYVHDANEAHEHGPHTHTHD